VLSLSRRLLKLRRLMLRSRKRSLSVTVSLLKRSECPLSFSSSWMRLSEGAMGLSEWALSFRRLGMSESS
jgi:hypothetical protein